MNLTALARHVPPAVLGWLTEHAPAALDPLARAVAITLCRWLLRDEGAADDAGLRTELLLRCQRQDAALAAVVAALPLGRRWTPNTVAAPICEYLGLHGAERALRDELSVGESCQSQDAAA